MHSTEIGQNATPGWNLAMHTAVIAASVTGAFIAYVNGANDVSKGIATLAGSGITNYRRAILWGAAWTTLGVLAAFGFARAMISTFGKGLLNPGITPSLSAAIATIVGAGVWVAVATRFSLPVSTTHAIVGSIAGVVTIAYGIAGMRWSILGTKIALPLLLSPIVALVMTNFALKVCRWARPTDNFDCLCAEVAASSPALATGPGGLQMSVPALPEISVIGCRETERKVTHSNGITITLNHLHWASSACTSFARG